jgi:pimeloyl-ACP methyl ester carboxylesterase
MPDRPLACARAESRTLALRGLALRCLDWGGAGRPPLLLLHGGAAHAHWFDAVVEPFLDAWHVVSLDQRGHGESAWAVPPAYGTEDFTGDLEAVLDAFGWARATVVGHSMGGHNAMAFAAFHPARVRALVVVDSRPAIPPDRLDRMHARGRRGPRRHPTLAAAVAAFRLLPPETVAAPALLEHMARAGVARRDGTFAYRFDPATSGARRPADLWPSLPRITAPTLIVRGERSIVLTEEIAERMRALVRGARLVTIRGAYHHLTLDRPAEFAAALGAFLAEVGAA